MNERQTDEHPMSERQRDGLLEEVYRSSGTVGRSIPETARLDGESVPVREFYFAVADRDELGAAERERVEAVLSDLRRRRLALVQRIEDRAVSYERGRELVSRIRDLDRTINAFESLEEPSLTEQRRRQKIRSAEELIALMRAFGEQ